MNGPRYLRAEVCWVRDEGCIWVINPRSGQGARLDGPDAQLWESWQRNGDLPAVIHEVALCWDLPLPAVHLRLKALLDSLEECGAVSSSPQSDHQGPHEPQGLRGI